MTVPMTVRTDTEIEQLVRQELIWDDRVDSTDITVNVLNGVVTLTGTVPSYSQLSLASADAWKIEGVRDVDNLLTVSIPETITVPSDAQTETNVENMLRWNATVDSVDIEVSVTNGTVTLEGTVDDYWQMWRAEDLVSDMSGVILVENHLTVVPTDSFVDQDIAEDIVGTGAEPLRGGRGCRRGGGERDRDPDGPGPDLSRALGGLQRGEEHRRRGGGAQ